MTKMQTREKSEDGRPETRLNSDTERFSLIKIEQSYPSMRVSHLRKKNMQQILLTTIQACSINQSGIGGITKVRA